MAKYRCTLQIHGVLHGKSEIETISTLLFKHHHITDALNLLQRADFGIYKDYAINISNVSEGELFADIWQYFLAQNIGYCWNIQSPCKDHNTIFAYCPIKKQRISLALNAGHVMIDLDQCEDAQYRQDMRNQRTILYDIIKRPLIVARNGHEFMTMTQNFPDITPYWSLRHEQ